MQVDKWPFVHSVIMKNEDFSIKNILRQLIFLFSTELVPYEKYGFVLEACTYGGCTSSSKVIFKTLADLPEGTTMSYILKCNLIHSNEKYLRSYYYN